MHFEVHVIKRRISRNAAASASVDSDERSEPEAEVTCGVHFEVHESVCLGFIKQVQNLL